MFADVLILRPDSRYDQLLTYIVPAQLEGLAHGMLVSVMVRNKQEKGIVMELKEQVSGIKNLRPMGEVLSKEPVISSEALLLSKWMSEYYLCPLNKTVQLFLLTADKNKAPAMLCKGPEELGEQLLISKWEKEIYLAVTQNKNQKSSMASINRRFGPEAQPAVNSLLKLGLLEKKEILQGAASQEIRIIESTDTAPDWQTLAKKAPKQAEILRALASGPKTEIEMKRTHVLCGRVLNILAGKGWIAYGRQDCLNAADRLYSTSGRTLQMNSEQTYASEKICASIRKRERKNWLLFGVTGSGKTEVYIRAIEEAIKSGRQALYLLPEIALAQMTTQKLIEKFGLMTAVINSTMSDHEKLMEWQKIKKQEAMIVIGPRSAVFAPFADLGLIIIDEEHENTFKQNEPDPRYDARTVAEKAAEIYGSVIVRGSATPSLQTYYLAGKGQYEMLRLKLRVATRPHPDIRVVDMKKENISGQRGLFSSYLQERMRKVLASGEQVILFMNRRGFHTFLICRECGTTIKCPHCSIAMTYHKTKGKLICHYCNYQRSAPQKCPTCGSGFMQYYGTGTERVAAEFEALFPQIPYTRIDTDTTQNKGSHLRLLQEFEQGKSRVLIGTQMIAKGLDFPAVTLVGIINSDALINMPDYQSGERAFQLITQVSGRAGRGDKSGEVIIQTYDPEHYVYKYAQKQDYVGFIEQELNNRSLLNYPPFQYIIRILVTGNQEKMVQEEIERIQRQLCAKISKTKSTAEKYGPSPAPIFYLKGRYRYHLILKGDNLKMLQEIVKEVKNNINTTKNELRIIIDVEPQNMM